MKSLYSKRRPYFDLIFGVLYTGLGVSYFLLYLQRSVIKNHAKRNTRALAEIL